MLIQLQDDQPIGHPIMESNFRQLFPNTSFSKYLTPEDAENFGYGLYEFSKVPNPGKYEKIVEVTPTKDERGVWMQTWDVIPMSDLEKKEDDEKKIEEIRNYRNFLLSQSDWTQSRDVTLTNDFEWTSYRQALRDITTQEGFPHNVTWPEKP